MRVKYYRLSWENKEGKTRTLYLNWVGLVNMFFFQWFGYRLEITSDAKTRKVVAYQFNGPIRPFKNIVNLDTDFGIKLRVLIGGKQ